MSDEDYNGEWHKDFKELEGVHELRGHTFALEEVEDGDGVYEDQKGRSYNVDAGTIGVIPIELCEGTIDKLLVDKFGTADKKVYKETKRIVVINKELIIE